MIRGTFLTLALLTAGCALPPTVRLSDDDFLTDAGPEAEVEEPLARVSAEARDDDCPKKENHDDKKDEDDKDKDKDKAKKQPAATLFQWAIGPEEEEEEEEPQSPLDRPLVSDRPDFTEASSTVGRGVIQFEGGYTYVRDAETGLRFNGHSFPEALFRIGLFADWFELRIGQNFGTESERLNGDKSVASGAFDLYLGVKLALTEQKKYLPEAAIILQMTVPTGSPELTDGEVLPGFNLCYSWEIIPDCLSLGCSTQANRVQSVGDLLALPPEEAPEPIEVGEVHHAFVGISQSASLGYTLTEKLGAYTEWFALFPVGAIHPDDLPEYYLDGGFTYQVTYNLQFDIRAGVGLNRHADNFFTGAGVVIRH